jgi:glycosyltransferase involved in cell wall biosynthesis
MSAKKVLLIIPEMITGGAQRSLANLSLELSQHFQVWLVVFNHDSPVAYKHGGKLLSLDVVPGKSWFSKIASLRKRVLRLRQIKRELEIDVAISFLEGADYVNVLSRNTEKIILSIRGSKIHDEIMHNSFFWLRSKILIPGLYRKADTLVAVNAGIANELHAYYGLAKSKIHTIGNFYNPDQIGKLLQEPRTEDLEKLFQHPVLVSTGRLNKEKGLDYLIRIFAKLKNTHKNVKLVIVGDGPEKERLILLAGQLGLKSGVQLEWTDVPDLVFAGNQENVFKFLNKASLYVTNSSSEGFPNGIVEAMICGVPVASSNCPYGPAEILAPGKKIDANTVHISDYGILLPIANNDKTVNIWADNLSQLLKNDSLRRQLAENAFVRASEFKKENVLDQWLKLIHE